MVNTTMNRIVLLGNSIAAITAAEEIRKGDSAVEIVVFSYDGTLPFFRSRLPAFVTKECSRNQACYQNPAYYERNNIILSAEKIGRINLNRNRVVTEEKKIYDYDFLIISDIGVLPKTEVKGWNKTGFLMLGRLSSAEEAEKALPYSDTVAVCGNDLTAFRTVCAVAGQKKEVLWIVAEKDILPGVCDEETSRVVGRLLEESGVRVIRENSVKEVLGDNDVKAVRLSSGKVLATQLVLWGEAKPDLRILKDLGLNLGEGISVDESYRANFKNVFAVDRISSRAAETPDGYDDDAEYLMAQGRRVAAVIKDAAQTITPLPVPQAVISLLDKSFHFLGQTSGKESDRSLVRLDETKKAYQKFFIAQNRLTGAILINSSEQSVEVLRLLESRTELRLEEQEALGQPAARIPAGEVENPSTLAATEEKTGSDLSG